MAPPGAEQSPDHSRTAADQDYDLREERAESRTHMNYRLIPSSGGGHSTLPVGMENKNLINDLAYSAPIDHDKVSSIKKAISSGNYPLDLDKISDALMEAYNEMKS